MNKYKTYEELKEELGDKFEEFMYKANIELLTKIDKAIEYIENNAKPYAFSDKMLKKECILKLLEILKGGSNE